MVCASMMPHLEISQSNSVTVKQWEDEGSIHCIGSRGHSSPSTTGCFSKGLDIQKDSLLFVTHLDDQKQASIMSAKGKKNGKANGHAATPIVEPQTRHIETPIEPTKPVAQQQQAAGKQAVPVVSEQPAKTVSNGKSHAAPITAPASAPPPVVAAVPTPVAPTEVKKSVSSLRNVDLVWPWEGQTVQIAVRKQVFTWEHFPE